MPKVKKIKNTSNSARAPQHRSWCFTKNNYTDADILQLNSLKQKYLLYGKETCPSTGTPHLQGYVVWNSPCTFSAISKKLPSGCHIEDAKADANFNYNYCTKDGDYYEEGVKPKDPKTVNTERWEEAWSAAKQGQLDSIPADLRLRYYRTFKEIRKDYMVKPVDLDVLDNEWHYGPPGTGKSTTVREENKNIYIKQHNNKWFDGYQNEECILIDDFDKYDIAMAGNLKIWADKFAFQAETKGGALFIRPKRIVITSNYSIEEIWEDAVTREALNRRFHVKPYYSLSRVSR